MVTTLLKRIVQVVRRHWAQGHLAVVVGFDAGPPGGFPPLHSNQPPGGPHAESSPVEETSHAALHLCSLGIAPWAGHEFSLIAPLPHR
ncbi:MAG: hypothetical protein WBN62_13280, partial [Thermoanaerobaculia bacterium]